MAPSIVATEFYSMNGHTSQPLEANNDGPLDLICIGFGPAALAIAVALHDMHVDANVLFLERQQQFAWHAGMLLPGAKMQISFLKDLATLRDPCSRFTFLNYLKAHGRLESFANLDTFLPLREEFNDYLCWVAKHFSSLVRYNTEVGEIHQEARGTFADQEACWRVSCRDARTGRQTSYRAPHVVIAVGGSPKLPRGLKAFGPNTVHSSQYLQAIRSRGQSDSLRKLAVIGGGQSAAEVFDDLTQRFPEAQVKLFIAGSALKPSDDSPYVNEIFNADQVDTHYALEPDQRSKLLTTYRATNYSVVRPELLNKLYYKVEYMQLLREPDRSKWQHQIKSSHELCRAESDSDTVTLHFTTAHAGTSTYEESFDLAIFATGYTRSAHENMLSPIHNLLASGPSETWRDYSVKMKPELVSPSCKIWLQGCCEASHGISDSLLSILAVRGGELVQSIFGERIRRDKDKVLADEHSHAENGTNGQA